MLKPEAATESCEPEADELAASAGSISWDFTSAGEPSCPEEIVLVGGGHKPRETVADDFVFKRLRGAASPGAAADDFVFKRLRGAASLRAAFPSGVAFFFLTSFAAAFSLARCFFAISLKTLR